MKSSCSAHATNPPCHFSQFKQIDYFAFITRSGNTDVYQWPPLRLKFFLLFFFTVLQPRRTFTIAINKIFNLANISLFHVTLTISYLSITTRLSCLILKCKGLTVPEGNFRCDVEGALTNPSSLELARMMERRRKQWSSAANTTKPQCHHPLLLAPSGALIAIPTYYWSTHPPTPPTFSDHTGPQHWTFTFWATTAI